MRRLIACAVFALTSTLALADSPAPLSPGWLAAHDKLMAKMDAIVFEKIELNKISIKDAIEYLNQESKRLDPDHVGVRMVLHHENEFTSAPMLSLSLKHVTLREVLKHVCPFWVEDTNVFCFYDSGEGLSLVTFVVPTGVFQLNGPDLDKESVDVTSQLGRKGLPFSPGSTATYSPKTNKVIVRGTDELVEDVDYYFYKLRQSKI